MLGSHVIHGGQSARAGAAAAVQSRIHVHSDAFTVRRRRGVQTNIAVDVTSALETLGHRIGSGKRIPANQWRRLTTPPDRWRRPRELQTSLTGPEGLATAPQAGSLDAL